MRRSTKACPKSNVFHYPFIEISFFFFQLNSNLDFTIVTVVNGGLSTRYTSRAFSGVQNYTLQAARSVCATRPIQWRGSGRLHTAS